MTIKVALLSAVGFAICMSANAFAASSTTLCWGQYRTNGEFKLGHCSPKCRNAAHFLSGVTEGL
jgi:hypothetical protein